MSPSEFLLIFCGHIWGIGMAAMALYSLFSMIHLKKRLVGAMHLDENVWLCDGIESPFVLGIFRPKIYLPSTLDETALPAILAHERCHIRRLDPAAKLFAWLALCLHWFNPLVWLCFSRFAEDVEMACDEAVTADMSPEERASYTDSLLHLSIGKRPHAAPLAFGEGDPTNRIKRILLFRQPKRAVVTAGICAVVVLAFFLVAEHAHSPHLLGGGYVVDEVLYRNPISSFYISKETAPDYTITGDYHLLQRYNHRDLDIADFTPEEKWEDLGQLQPCDLNQRDLQQMMRYPDLSKNIPRIGKIIDAWYLQSKEGNGPFFLLIQTSAGKTLLAMGYGDFSKRDNTDIHKIYIAWLAHLEPMSGVMVITTDYFELDAYHLTGQNTTTIGKWENHGEGWYLHAFSTEEGGLGFASYQWEGNKKKSQLKDGFLKLMQAAYYPSEKLDNYLLGVTGCYIAPDPIVTKVGDDPAVSLTINRTYDAVFVTNDSVCSVKRTVIAQNGTIINEEEHKLPTDDTIVITWPRMFLFSWAQEEGHNSCSVSYSFLDRDGNILVAASGPIPEK